MYLTLRTMPRTKSVANKGKGAASSSSENLVAVNRRFFKSDEEFALFEDVCLNRKVIGEHIFEEKVLRKLKFAYLDRLIEWGWMPFLANKRNVYPNVVRAFYFNGELSIDSFDTSVLGEDFEVNMRRIRAALGGSNVMVSDVSEPPIRFNYIEACRRIFEDPSIARVVTQVKNLPFNARILHLLVCHSILPRSGKFSSLNRDDIFVMDCIIRNQVLNLPGVILRHMLKAAENVKKPKLSHGLPYGKLICTIIEALAIVNDAEPIAVCEKKAFQLHAIERLGWHFDPLSREWVRTQDDANRGVREEAEEEEASSEDLEPARARIDTMLDNLDEIKDQLVQSNRNIEMLLRGVLHNHNSISRIERSLNIPPSSSPFPFTMPPQEP